MEKLNRKFLAAHPELAEKITVGSQNNDMPERIIQFGEGNFLRGFVTWMVNRLNANGLFNGKVVVAQPIKVGLAKLINDQDGLYTLLMRGISEGKELDNREIVTCISRGIDPYSQYDALMECARNPEMRFMISNTTEAGIVYVDEPRPRTECPTSFPAKVCAFLYERFKHFNGAQDKGMVIICCELIDRNASQLKKIVFKLARQWELRNDFLDWVESSCTFVNTLVDRIVPGYPRDNAEEICGELGYNDQLLDTTELFHLWVLEGANEIAEELPFHKLGLNVVWTDDMTPYRTRKVRMLNGAHTSSVLGAYLAGIDTVGEMMNDDLFAKFVEKILLDEILPQVPGEYQSNKEFALSILDRFRNPFIRHELLSISLNSVSKWKVRVLPSIKDYLAAKEALPPMLTYSLAALIAFYHGVGSNEPELRGTRNGKSYSIKDGIDELVFFEKRWHAFHHNHDLRVLVGTILANEALWGEDLTLLPGMVDMVTSRLQSILTLGVRETVTALVK